LKRDLFDLTGKVAMVTGAGGGLGAAIAEGYADYGAAVALIDLDVEATRAVLGRIEAGGGRGIAIGCNVTKEEQVETSVAQTLTTFGQIDVLANVAGISGRAPAEDMTAALWDRVIEVNLKGTFLFCVRVGREMIKRGQGGRIINMASVAGVVGLTTGNLNYSAAKGGVIAMTRVLAVEWAKHNILVNAVAPTHFETPLIADLLAKKPETRDYIVGNIPLRRLGQPEEIVGPFVFLASAASSMVTGHCLMVDGGHTAW
jgi:NAD(P)-dependent dehydrogenase (short-subunit alcohol dehydrogenase family)